MNLLRGRPVFTIVVALVILGASPTAAAADDACDGVTFFENQYTGDRNAPPYLSSVAYVLEACAEEKLPNSAEQYTFTDRAANAYARLGARTEKTAPVTSFIAYVRAYDLTDTLLVINRNAGFGSARSLTTQLNTFATAIRRTADHALPAL